jgi:hypothetical protein
MKTFLLQLWLSVKIWLVAVAVNTMLGTVYLSDFKLLAVADLVTIGVCLGAFFSFPIMLVICTVINRCAAAGKPGSFLLSLLLITNVVLATVAFMIFCGQVGVDNDMLILLCIAIFSGIIGITTFYKSILKWGGNYNNPQKYSHEN